MLSWRIQDNALIDRPQAIHSTVHSQTTSYMWVTSNLTALQVSGATSIMGIFETQGIGILEWQL
jgi:hypothetical protein